jgi:hypothetical protein
MLGAVLATGGSPVRRTTQVQLVKQILHPHGGLPDHRLSDGSRVRTVWIAQHRPPNDALDRAVIDRPEARERDPAPFQRCEIVGRETALSQLEAHVVKLRLARSSMDRLVRDQSEWLPTRDEARGFSRHLDCVDRHRRGFVVQAPGDDHVPAAVHEVPDMADGRVRPIGFDREHEIVIREVRRLPDESRPHRLAPCVRRITNLVTSRHAI